MRFGRSEAAAGMIAVAAAVMFTCRATVDPDLFWHLVQGQAVLSGAWVRTNLFSATAAATPQPYVSWAFEAMLAFVARAGLGGVQVIEGALVAGALVGLMATARVRSSGAAALATLLVSLLVLEPRVMPRPYLASWLGVAACAWWWERQRGRVTTGALMWRSIWPVAVLVGLWANLHAEAVFGAGWLLVLGLAGTASRDAAGRPAARAALVAGALGLVATLVTPYGLGLWRYLFENALVPETLRIAELQPPSPSAYPAFFVYLAVLAIALASAPARLTLPESATVAIFAALGVGYIRFTPLVVFAAAPLVARRLDLWIARGWHPRAVLVTALAVVVATLPASPIRMARAWRVGADALAPPEYFSREAVAAIRARGLTGPVFTSLNQGGFIAWAVPGARPFQDSRLQAYPPGHFARIIAASADPAAWHDLTRGLDWAVVSRVSTNELSGAGQFTAPEWARVFQDRAVDVFVLTSR